MSRIIYATSASLDGYLADADGSLDWLFAVQGGDAAIAELKPFVEGVSVMVEGSTTYEWVMDHEQLLEHPEKWREFYGTRKTYVFTTRAGSLPRVPDADIEFLSGPVSDHISAILAAAGDGDVWLTGGGAIATQFAELGHIDEIWLSVAPVFLGGGAPVFTRRMESDDLRLIDVHQTGQFVQTRYELNKPRAAK